MQGAQNLKLRDLASIKTPLCVVEKFLYSCVGLFSNFKSFY
jgi:hypothetical protein